MHRCSKWSALFLVFLPHAVPVVAGSDDSAAVFHVTPHVIAPDVGAFTATTGPATALVDVNFEPMVWRQHRFVVERDAVGRVYAAQLDHYDSYAPGFWDGADVRVLRVADGRVSERLRSRVKRFHHGAWTPVGGLAPADSRQAVYQFEPWSRPNQRWWLALRAVDSAGRESEFSRPVEVVNPEVPDGRRQQVNPTFSRPVPRADPAASGDAPAAPRNLHAEVEAETGVIRLTWDMDPQPLAGFRLYRTYVDPATHQGTWLEIDSLNGGDRFASKRGDLVLLTRRAFTFTKEFYSPRIYNSHEALPPPWAPHFTPDGDWRGQYLANWALVPHPAPLPDGVEDAGETCIRIEAPGGGVTWIRLYNHADTTQHWYPVLEPNRTYVVEILARHEGLEDPSLTFHLTGPYARAISPIRFLMTEQWQAFRAEFTVPHRLEQKGPVGQMGIQFRGPGVVWLDNFRVYEKNAGLVRHPPADRRELRESGMAALRTHDTCKTQGYTVENLLGHPTLGLNSGDRVFTRANLSALLREFAEMGVIPWLQLEFTLDELEWQAIVEYLAAPYDPTTDTPDSKPWAWRRVQHGQPRPYTEIFPRILIEFSNENWNPIMPFHLAGVSMIDEVTGRTYGPGEVYGLLQEYVIQTMKRSPYWAPAVDSRIEFVIGGWAVNRFGYEAARHSPSSHHVLIADYNGGWDAGENPDEVGDLDAALIKALNFPGQQTWFQAVRQRRQRDEFAEQTGRLLGFGTYEAGPGYNLDGLNNVRMTPEMVEFESRVMKSLAAGTATLDCFLIWASQGAKLQNFFTFSRNRHYWTSHAHERHGGQAYPSWMALSLFNRYGTGDMLAVLTEKVPVRHAPRVGRRPAAERIPEVSVYATRKGSRLSVFAVSRRLEGSLPVTVYLPIRSASRVTLHALTGDPRAHNLDGPTVQPITRELPSSVAGPVFAINQDTGASANGLPAASVYLYIFEGVRWSDDLPTAVLNPAPGQSDPAADLPVRFRAGFSPPPLAFTVENVALTGSAEPNQVRVEPVPGLHGHEYELIVSEVLSDGPVDVEIRDVSTPDGRSFPPAKSRIFLKFPPDTWLPILAWNFAAHHGPDPSTRVWAGRPIPPTRVLPVVQPTELGASRPNLLGDNIHYNLDGAGTWSGRNLADGAYFYTFGLNPSSGRQIYIGRVEAGFWASDRIDPRLEVWRGGEKVASIPFVAERPIQNRGLLHHDAGIRAVADTRSVAVLQPVAEPLELRIVFDGLERGGVFGIGKLGQEHDDLVVYGRLSR